MTLHVGSERSARRYENRPRRHMQSLLGGLRRSSRPRWAGSGNRADRPSLGLGGAAWRWCGASGYPIPRTAWPLMAPRLPRCTIDTCPRLTPYGSVGERWRSDPSNMQGVTS
jgi:hypothetical protein